jgi:competence protein ComEC
MKGFRARFLSFLALVGLAGAASAEQITPSSRVKRAVVVRVLPETDAPAVDRLRPGDQVLLVEERPGWYKIRLPDGREGFVSKSWTVLVGANSEAATTTGTGPFKVHVIDVGTGLAVFIEGPGFTMLYDGGSQDDLARGDDNRIIAYIDAVHPGMQTLDHLVLSHPHKDHLELLPDVFERFAIKNIWDSGAVNPTNGYCRFLKKVQAETNVQYHDAIASGGTHDVIFASGPCKGTIRIAQSTMMSATPVPLGVGAAMTMLYRDATRHADPNENSVVVRLDLGTKRILLAGDAEGGDREAPPALPKGSSIEGQLLTCCKADLRADLLVVGHHGSLTSSRQLFLDAVGASTFVISSGPHPYSSVVLPDAGIISALKARGAVFRTDLDDALCLSDTAKIGPDSDESPGGCKNVLITVSPSGALSVTYNEIAD